MKLSHIGIAVNSLKQGRSFWDQLLRGLPHQECVEKDQVKVAIYNLDGGGRVELLETLSKEGPVGRFLDKKGPGVHHLCFEVDNLAQTLGGLKSAGVKLIDEVPRPGANGCWVAFLHPSSTGGVLIELTQRKK